jgi:hypothetical protein
VQKVEVFCQVKACKNCEFYTTPKEPVAVWWEEFPVEKGKVTNATRTKWGYTDEGSLTTPLGKCGRYEQFAYVRFYCKKKEDDPRPPNQRAETGDLQWKGQSFAPECGGPTETGEVGASADQPTWWNRSDGGLNAPGLKRPSALAGEEERHILVSYCCCDDKSWVKAWAFPVKGKTK